METRFRTNPTLWGPALTIGTNAIDTKWVSVPGLLTARCATNDNATYLEITCMAIRPGPRTDDIAGDLGANGQIATDWGLHLIDVNLAMGNVVDIAGQQAKA